MKHVFNNLPIETKGKSFFSYFAEMYIKQRSGKGYDLTDSHTFNDSGFDVQELSRIIRKGSVKLSLTFAEDGKLDSKDLYRSELGEMLMTTYFEKKLPEEERFEIPVKLITDKETSEMASRGIDCVGLRIDPNKISLLIGEAKVSDEKASPPKSARRIYNTQLEHTQKDILIRKLSDFSKKLSDKHFDAMVNLLGFLEFEKTENYSITYGCTLVRDKDTVNIAADFGEMLSSKSNFDPHNVHFIILWFSDQTIEDTVKQFFAEVQKQVNE